MNSFLMLFQIPLLGKLLVTFVISIFHSFESFKYFYSSLLQKNQSITIPNFNSFATK